METTTNESAMTATGHKLAAKELAKRWVGRMVHSSITPAVGRDKPIAPARKVESIHYDEQSNTYVAFAGEHHRANTAEALDRRLQSLAV